LHYDSHHLSDRKPISRPANGRKSGCRRQSYKGISGRSRYRLVGDEVRRADDEKRIRMYLDEISLDHITAAYIEKYARAARDLVRSRANGPSPGSAGGTAITSS
jgi:hypothetical protein